MTIEMTVEVSFLARDVGDQMLARLEWMMLQPKKILEWGCKSHTEELKKRYPEAEIIQAEILTLPDHSVDFIFVNLFLTENIQQILQEWQRVLRPEGLLLFSSLGPDTCQEISKNNVISSLTDMHNLGDELIHARFADPVLDVESFQIKYREYETMIQELRFLKIISNDAMIPSCDTLTFEIIYGHAWGTGRTSENVVKVPLSQLRRR